MSIDFVGTCVCLSICVCLSMYVFAHQLKCGFAFAVALVVVFMQVYDCFTRFTSSQWGVPYVWHFQNHEFRWKLQRLAIINLLGVLLRKSFVARFTWPLVSRSCEFPAIQPTLCCKRQHRRWILHRRASRRHNNQHHALMFCSILNLIGDWWINLILVYSLGALNIL